MIAGRPWPDDNGVDRVRLWGGLGLWLLAWALPPVPAACPRASGAGVRSASLAGFRSAGDPWE
jgi:hypothetical protein